MFIKEGMRQGWSLTTLFFNLYAEEGIKEKKEIKIRKDKSVKPSR